MKIKQLLLVFLIAFTSFPGIAVPKNQNQRFKYNFNSSWLLRVGEVTGDTSSYIQPGYNDKSWAGITLPRAFNENEAFRVAIDEHTDTILWYRKHFRLPKSD